MSPQEVLSVSQLDEPLPDKVSQAIRIKWFLQARIGHRVQKLPRSGSKGSPGQEDHALGDIRKGSLQLPVKFDTAHFGHHHVRQNEVKAVAAMNQSDRLATTGDHHHLVFLGQRASDRGALEIPLSFEERGKRTRKMLPRPGSLSTVIAPPKAVTISWQIANPSPLPVLGGLVV